MDPAAPGPCQGPCQGPCLPEELRELILSFADAQTKITCYGASTELARLLPAQDVVDTFIRQSGKQEEYYRNILVCLRKGKKRVTFHTRNSYQRRFLYFLANNYGYCCETNIDHGKHHHNFHLVEEKDKYVLTRSQSPRVTMTLTKGTGPTLRIENKCTEDLRFGPCGHKEVTEYNKEVWNRTRIIAAHPQYIHLNASIWRQSS